MDRNFAVAGGSGINKSVPRRALAAEACFPKLVDEELRSETTGKNRVTRSKVFI